METKHCNKCDRLLPISSFWPDKRRKCGVRSWCIDCEGDYRKNNLDLQRKANDKYRAKNRHKIKRYYQKNSDDIRERVAKYKDENREEINAKARMYYRKNKEQVIRANLNQKHKRRSVYKKTDITPKWIASLKKKTKMCAICGEVMAKKELDHIIPISVGGEHTMANVRFVCPACNKRRPKDGSDNLAHIQTSLFAVRFLGENV